MKQYKCLTNGYGSSFIKGETYPSTDYDSLQNHTVSHYVNKFPLDWELVENNESAFPREMLVWDIDESQAKKRMVHAYVPTVRYSYITDQSKYRYAKEIPIAKLPVISGYKGELRANNTEIKYGCVTASISKLRKLVDASILSTNAEIHRVFIEGKVVSIKDIKQILQCVDSLKSC